MVAREFHPRKIILFGSYANGFATPDSDVDLLVILPCHRLATNQAVEIRGRVEAPFPLDLLVWEPEREQKDDSYIGLLPAMRRPAAARTSSSSEGAEAKW